MNSNFEIKTLSKKGFCYLDIFSEEEVKTLSENSNKIVEIFKKNKDLSLNNLSIAKKVDSVEACSKSRYSVLVDRRKAEYDNGMMDIFNPQKTSLSISRSFIEFRKKIEIYCLNLLEEKYKKKFKLTATHIYNHYQTTNPRCAHYDSEKDYFKLFLYLSDVDFKNGSFFFYENSHRQKIRKLLMNKLNKYILRKKNQEDINFIFSNKKKIDLMGKIGTTILANVSGIHGCNPFDLNNNKDRLVLVQRIEPI